MGWGGSGEGGAATMFVDPNYTPWFSTNPSHSGTYLFVGGVLMIIAGIFEFVLGNTFPFVVSCGFGKMSLRSIHMYKNVLTCWTQAVSGLLWVPP
jgi:succinate-acetate transporter protein